MWQSVETLVIVNRRNTNGYSCSLPALRYASVAVAISAIAIIANVY